MSLDSEKIFGQQMCLASGNSLFLYRNLRHVRSREFNFAIMRLITKGIGAKSKKVDGEDN
jgi:hypothetical protein